MRTSKKLRELRATHADLVAEARALIDKADAEKRDLSAEEAAQFDAIQAKIDGLNATIDREIKLVEMEASIDPRAAGHVSVHDNREDDQTRGFRSLGEFAQAVQAAGSPSRYLDERLTIGAAAPSTYSNESVGAEGGFAVPPQFSKEIWQLSIMEPLNLLPLTDNTPIESNSMVFPKDETTPWSTDGIQVYWKGEGSAATASKLNLKAGQMYLYELIALVPVTNELLSDSTALNGYFVKKVPTKMMWATNEAILYGNGSGKPMGALVAGGPYVTQAKESGQAAGSIVAANISNMVSRLLVGELANAIWMINPDTLPALESMTVGQYPIYLSPNQGLREAPYGLLKGRPVHLSEHCPTLGTEGDISLLSLSGYRTITKAGGLETATSMHLYFDANATAFRWIFRLDGKPILTSAVTPPKSSNTRSHFVTLATRS